MMRVVLICLVLSAILTLTDATACDDCYTAFNDNKGTDECGSLQAYGKCMEATTNCNATTAQITAINPSKAACTELTDTCSCQMAYWTTDFTDDSEKTKKCEAYRVFVGCAKPATGMACGEAQKTSATLLTERMKPEGCSSTCECQITYAKTGTDCAAKKAYAGCLKGKTEMSCDGTQKASQLASATFDSAFTTDCTPSKACKCETDYAQRDATATACTNELTYIGCLKSVDDNLNGCDGETTADKMATDHIEASTCTDTCKCQFTYANADKTAEKKCSSDKAYLMCLKGKTEKGCGDTQLPSALASSLADGAWETACTPSDTCKCYIQYARTDVTAEDARCKADKDLIMCSQWTEGVGCSGELRSEMAKKHMTDSKCKTKFSDTCHCQEMHAEMDLNTPEKKCISVKSFISCLRPVVGLGCDDLSTPKEVFDKAHQELGDLGDTCTRTATCDCEIAYAMNDVDPPLERCRADKALVRCLRNTTDKGCSDSVTVQSLLMHTEIGKPLCKKTKTCECELDFLKSNRSTPDKHCMASKKLFGCVYDDMVTDETCEGGSRSELKTEAKQMITDGTKCALGDTCTCQEMMMGKTCEGLKKGISCLTKATAPKGCDNMISMADLAAKAKTHMEKLDPKCAKSSTCQCELSYVMGDKSTTDGICGKAKDFKKCLSDVKDSSDKGCDGQTAASKILTDVAEKAVKAVCGAAYVPCSSLTLLFLMVALTMKLVNN